MIIFQKPVIDSEPNSRHLDLELPHSKPVKNKFVFLNPLNPIYGIFMVNLNRGSIGTFNNI